MNKSVLRILYAGSPLASAILLDRLLAAETADCGWKIAGVLTNPPSAQGRHKDLIPTAVAQKAQSAGIPFFSPEHLDSACRASLEPLQADLLICFDYGHIFGPKFLALFPLGGINLHPSLLPAYRGCTPVPAAILSGDTKLGISVQKLALKTDEGDILAQESLVLTGNETTGSLMDGDGSSSVVTDAGSRLILTVLTETVKGSIFALPPAVPQCGEATYTPFIKKEDGHISWNKTAAEIDRMIRAYTPWPGCYTSSSGVLLRIITAYPRTDCSVPGSSVPGDVLPYDKNTGISVVCGAGTVLSVTELQWQAKKIMSHQDFMNGARNFAGSHLE
jgi:methionyl-tRNA formyltransferase